MDLDIDVLDVGRKAPVVVTVIRPVREADMALWARQPAKVQAGSIIKRIRDSHHRLAKLLASGTSVTECSLITGYSVSRIYVLCTDPMFKETIAFYRENAQVEYSDFHATMASIATDAAQELHSRLDEKPEDMSSAFLKDLVTEFADRTGFAPVSKNVNVNVNTTLADRLGRARAREAAFSASQAEPRILAPASISEAPREPRREGEGPSGPIESVVQDVVKRVVDG